MKTCETGRMLITEYFRLESLKNLTERYDGYGNSIRRVMEQKSREPKILGVVADLIKVDKKYETAVEIALGGSIQNIVTADEETAKKMIGYLRKAEPVWTCNFPSIDSGSWGTGICQGRSPCRRV